MKNDANFEPLPWDWATPIDRGVCFVWLPTYSVNTKRWVWFKTLYYTDYAMFGTTILRQHWEETNF